VRAIVDLETWSRSDEAKQLPLNQVEDQVVTRGREALRLLLQGHIDERAQAEVGADAAQMASETGPILLTHHLHRTRQQRTTLGSVDIERTGYGYPGQSSVFPLDHALQIPGVIYSYPLQKHMVRGAVRGPFAEAAKTVEEYTGEKVPKRSVEALLEAAASDFEGFYAEREAVPPPAETSDIVVSTVDCKGVPMIPSERTGPSKDGSDKKGVKRMAVVTATYTVAPRPRTPEEVVESLFRDPDKPKAVKSPDVRPEAKRVSASLSKTKDQMIQEMAADVQRRDPNGTKIRVTITDGERALKKRVLALVPGTLLILDLLHALGYLWKAGKLLFADDAEGTAIWVKRQALQILQGRVSHVVRGIRQSVTKRKIEGTAKADLLGAAAYLYGNRHYMAYHEYLAKGYPIASGAVEGAGKSVIRDRMERSGMRWSAATAEPLLKLRAVYLSDDFDAYWAYHVRREQARMHPEAAAWELVDID
jgi:hypothetical protein